jgi:cation transport regulator ChaC
MAFGLVGREGPGALVAVGRFADGAQPYAAHLILRDAARSDGPYLARLDGGSTAGLPLAQRLPPRGAQKTYAAAARAAAGPDLLPKGATSGWAFRFPDDAAQELAGLDPRESVAVEFLFPGDVARRAYVEVGDFAAGRAFLQLAGR